ncbi:hypothetical protein [Streptomyces sp. NPDC002788]
MTARTAVAEFTPSGEAGPVRTARLTRNADGWTLTLTGAGDRLDLLIEAEGRTVAEEPSRPR